VNPNLARLKPYPFARQRVLFEDLTPNPKYRAISLGIGEPKHPTPLFIKQALADNLAGLANYPTTNGSDALRAAIAGWICRRYGLAALDPLTQVLPVNGSREALFAFAQSLIDPGHGDAVVICPNPFYQVYEGAALLAGATPYYVNSLASNGFAVNWDAVPETIWRRCQLLYVCSPANPTGAVIELAEWQKLFELSDRYGFVIASDECYSEIYFDEARPPLGSLAAAAKLGRAGFPRLAAFSSLSKRSNVPGMRSGFVAGDAALLKDFFMYRTYHGSAMNPVVQAASIAAWNDEEHVLENRRLYREKFEQVLPLIGTALEVGMPAASFYLWAKTPVADTEFARGLYRDYNVNVLPGSYLARDAQGVNPGLNYVRMALVAPLEECLEAAARVRDFAQGLASQNQERRAAATR
jgi:N-succinyldiaminopimelate aminotransferase